MGVVADELVINVGPSHAHVGAKGLLIGVGASYANLGADGLVCVGASQTPIGTKLMRRSKYLLRVLMGLSGFPKLLKGSCYPSNALMGFRSFKKMLKRK